MNELCGDYQQGGCLYNKPTSGIQWTPKHLWMSYKPHKQTLEKAGQSTYGSGVVVISLLMELSIDDENILYHCVQVWWVLVKARVIQTTLT